MDNARPHTAVITPQYLAAMGLRLHYHSPYSRDLNLCDWFLFTRLKEVVRLVQYDIKDEVAALPLEDYLIHEFHKFWDIVRLWSDQEGTTLHADIVDFM